MQLGASSVQTHLNKNHRLPLRPGIARFAVVLFIALLTLAVAGCNESKSVRVENKTEQTIVVYEDSVPTELIAPGETKEFSTQQFRGTLTYDIRYFCDTESCDQSVLVTRTTTWEEITRMDGITLTIQ